MNSSELLTLFRSEMSDVAEPYLWSDVEVFNYLDDAQKMYCRLTDGIADASTEDVVKLSIEPGSDWLVTHHSILRIRSANRADTGRTVEVLNADDMPLRRWFFDGTTGWVRALIIGQEANKVRIYPKSSETADIMLTVFRLPLIDITDAGDQALEIPAIHHQHLLLWVKHRAYSKQDAETFDRTKAEEFEARFKSYCAMARDEERRRAYKPRSVTYGGI